MLIDNSIMKLFGAKLDWAAERLSFQDSNVTIPATHMRRSLKSEYYSVITQTGDAQIPVLVSRIYVVSAAHEETVCVCCLWLCSVVPSCATQDDVNKAYVCTPTTSPRINRPPHLRPSRTYPEL